MSGDQIPGTGHIGYPLDPADSFGRMNVAQPVTLFEAQFNYGLQPSLFDQYVTNGNIVHVPAHSAVRLSTGGGTVGNRAVFQSRKYIRYQPGKAHNLLWTCVLGSPKADVRQIAGLIDDEDGLAFVQDGSGLGVLMRTSTSGMVVDNIVPQAEWNLDRLDGTGKSEIPLDVTKNNIMVIDMQWLGAGRVRWGFDFGGHITYCHQSQWANTVELPFMRTANLPFRVEIKNTGSADGETTLDFTCVTVYSNGGSKQSFLTRSTNNAEATAGADSLRSVTSATEALPVLSIRPRASFNGLTNRGQVRPTSCQVASKDAAVAYSIIQNGTLVDASFSDVNSDSIVEVDTSATGISGGIVVASGYLGADIGMPGMGFTTRDMENIILSNNIQGDTTETLTVAIRLADGVSSGCAGGFTWQELR